MRGCILLVWEGEGEGEGEGKRWKRKRETGWVVMDEAGCLCVYSVRHPSIMGLEYQWRPAPSSKVNTYVCMSRLTPGSKLYTTTVPLKLRHPNEEG